MNQFCRLKEKARGIHPRICYGKQEIETFRASIATSAQFRENVIAIQKKSDELLQQELLSEEYANAAQTQHGNFYEIGAQLCDFAANFGFLYQLGETKYIEKMKQALLHYVSFAAWTGPTNKHRKVPWQSDLSTTRILRGFAIAYDTMYDVFTEKERETIRNAMLTLGIHPLLSDWMYDGARVHALDSMGHNWWAVCTALAGLGLCAIYDEVPSSESILCDILASLHAFCDYEGEPLLNKVSNFDDRGMFYESCSYFNYGIGELCQFLFGFRRCFEDDGLSDIPVLHQVSKAYLSMVYPVSGNEKNLYVDFGDSALSTTGDTRDPMTALPQYLLLLGYGDEQLKRYYCRAKRIPDLNDMLYPKELSEWDGKLPVQAKSELYPKTGLAFLRSGNAVDGTLLAVRCGFTWNHAHDDAGTFILMRNGESVLCDSGTVSYGRADYIRHYCSAGAHNVVTVNGHGQHPETLYRGNKFPGRLLHFMENGSLAYLLADATGPMCNTCMRNHRSFLRLEEDIYIVVDDLYTYEPSEFAFLLHYNGEMTENGASMRIQTEKNALTVTTVSPYAFTRELREYDGKKCAAILQKEYSRLCNFMHIITPNEISAVVNPISGNDWYGAQIICANHSYRIFYNFEADGRCMHINSHNHLAEWDSDAYLLCEVDGGKQMIMAYGSYLRKDGISHEENLKKTFKIMSL